MAQEGLLAGVKVVELATFVAAPSATRYMSHLGADVIKVEDTRGGGDACRTLGISLNLPNDEMGNPLYDQVNGCKRSLALNLKDPDAKNVLLKLLEDTDVFVVNVRARSLEKLGLDYETLKERFPRLVYAHVTGYGDCGPDKDLPAFDTTAFWAATGFTNDLSVDVGELTHPTDNASGVGDNTTGGFLFGAIISALYAREKTGRGDRVTVSLFGVASWVMSLLVLSTQDKYGRKYPRTHETMTPPPFKCADGKWLTIALMANWQYYFPRFCEALGIPEVAEDPRFKEDVAYLKPENSIALCKLVEPIIAQKPSDYWMSLLNNDFNVVCAVLGHFRDVSKSTQAAANGFVVDHTMPNGEQCKLGMPPFRSNNMAAGGYRYGRAPLLGENSVEIMREIGIPEAEIETMVERGAVAQHSYTETPLEEVFKPAR